MTQEQKAKAYDLAIEAAKKYHNGTLKDVMETIFSELKESENERIKKALIDYFDNANKADENPLLNYGIHTDEVIAWLKNQYEQKPTEWSEEDEKILDEVITNYESGYLPSVEKRDEIIEKLKSLKDRYTWKPSEAQIIALDEVYKTHGANSACRRILLKLLNDLKKL